MNPEELAKFEEDYDKAAFCHFVLGEHHLCPVNAPCRNEKN